MLLEESTIPEDISVEGFLARKALAFLREIASEWCKKAEIWIISSDYTPETETFTLVLGSKIRLDVPFVENLLEALGVYVQQYANHHLELTIKFLE